MFTAMSIPVLGRFASLALLFALTASTDVAFAAAEEKSGSQFEKDKLAGGIYLVLRKASQAEDLKPLKIGEYLRIDDGQLLEPNPGAKQDSPQYITVAKDKFVPMVLNSEPRKNKDEKCKTRLLLQLSPGQIMPLEGLTKGNIGKQVAIIVADRVVTVHKVRESIVGGRLQITRCTDNGCDVLYTELQKDVKNPGEKP